MKKLLIILFIGISSSAFSQYCTLGGPTSNADSDVGAFALIGETMNINMAATCPGTIGLEDQTATQIADLLADSTYTLSIEFSSCSFTFTNAAQVWIDYDNDQTFEQNEVIASWTGSAPSGIQTYNFTVPTWVCDGSRRMRIVQEEGGTLPLDPCASYSWGSAVDVTISITTGTCQIAGCTDTNSFNYDALAVIDDGFCVPFEGVNCDTPNVIVSLPFNATGINTSYYGSNYSSVNACGSSYMDGNDYVFEYTATSTECINVALSQTVWGAGVFILDGCPNGGANCLAQGNGTTATANTTVNAGTYYIVVSSDNSFGGPQSISFDIDITSTSAGSIGSTCGTPHVITGNFAQTGMTTSCFGNDYNSSMGCGSLNMDGDDYVFEYTPVNDTCITISLDNAEFSAGLFLLDGCPNSPGVNCIGESTGNSSLQIYKNSVTAGNTYYIVVSTDGFPSSTAFDIDIQEVNCPVPNNQDCAGAQPLCLGVFVQDSSFEGEGDVQFEFSTSNTCFGQANGGPAGEVEVNSAWYTFTVPGSGNLNFTITPNDATNDYDWAVFDITGPDHSCETLHQDGAVSCNWSGSPGPTGPNGMTGDQNEAPFGVVAGNTYAVVITNYSDDQDGYELDFTESTADVYASDLNTNDQDICRGETANLDALYTGPSFGSTTYSWFPNSMVEDSISPSTVTTAIEEDSIIFYVRLTLGEACEFQDSLIVRTYDGTSEFSVEYDSILCPVIVDIENTSGDDAVNYYWDFADNTTFEGRDPEPHAYILPGVYNMELITETSIGCLDTAYQEIVVPEMSIPNIMTPNGDGINDFLVVNCLEEGYDLTVYNRWGKKVAEIYDYDNSWNGDDLVDGKYYCTLTNRQTWDIITFKAWFYISR